MDLGFETIGNATLVCHDKGPLLVTDPWIQGPAYFGSWTCSHEIPQEQFANIKNCKFVWVSHGHPDHLSSESVELLKDKKFLIADHVGNRICDDLTKQGYDVQILKSREWVTLSERIRILSLADYNQDSILLVDIGGVLVADINDASDCGWARFVRKVIHSYDLSFLLMLSGHGDANMINVFDEGGRLITRPPAEKEPVGRQIARLTTQYRARYFVPFSSMHRYQRFDSIWANAYTTGLEDYGKGFASTQCELLPAFIKYDCTRRSVEPIEPAEAPHGALSPETFGDDWSEDLHPSDTKKLYAYFERLDHVRNYFGFLRFKVGSRTHTIDLNGKDRELGITFEAPRHSLMSAVEYEVFDDLLIGNFMKTTLHGNHGDYPLYPDFTPFVAKYADNGRARTKDELTAYFAAYRKRAPIDYFYTQMERATVGTVRRLVPSESRTYSIAKKLYHRVKEL